MIRYKTLLVALCMLMPALAMADDENARITPLLTTTETIAGQPIVVPAHPKLQAMMFTIAPGQSLPIHKHPYIRYAYVEKGALDVTLVDQKKTLHFKAGDFFAEAIDAWHYGTNNGKVPVELLIIDQMPQDVESNTVKQAR